jgi:Rrf2 family transcriptional regulator, iron-sulfur cluster assembly transcription factor
LPPAGVSAAGATAVTSPHDMRLSRESDYALEGLRVLAGRPLGTVMLLRDIAAAALVPSGVLPRIFRRLVQHHVVVSRRGAVRGYALARPARETALGEILVALEGPSFLDQCVFSGRSCGADGLCCLHAEWVRLREELARAVQHKTLADMAPRAAGAMSAERTGR